MKILLNSLSYKTYLRISARVFVVVMMKFPFIACESSVKEEKRLLAEEKSRAYPFAEDKRIEEDKAKAFQEAEKERLKKEENERKERAIYDKYGRNSLSTGTTPYSACFGGNGTCSDWGCSEIKVQTPKASDVVVTIKKENKVIRHVYIEANSNFTFQLPNGTYQTFFYYGNGWNPEKDMKSTSCTALKGGFLTGEIYGKDSQVILENDVLTYELILQKNGNFSTTPSNPSEMF